MTMRLVARILGAVAVAALLVLTGAAIARGTQPAGRSAPVPTPPPAPVVSVEIPQDLEADLICSAQGGEWSGHYGYTGGERVPVCVVP